jgi:transcription elongation factor GreA
MNDDLHTTYITKEGLEKLKRELEDLRNEKIPDIASRIDEARQQGDLSENAEYHIAREDMSWAQTRVIELEETLRNVEIIEKASASTVQMGSTVKVEANGKEKEYAIVGVQEVDPLKGLISHESPLAIGLLGHSKGETVEINMPSGLVEYKIIEIN